MWSTDPLESDAELRQGDLLAKVQLPKLKAPFAVAHVPGSEPTPSSSMVIASSQRDMLVVSQCCDIENGRYAALAPIISTPPLEDRLRAALLADQPPASDPDEETGYVFDQFRLAPLEGIVAEAADRFKVADLGQIVSLSGDLAWLRAHRVARMTPAGRRLLRIKLSYFFARPEAEDQAWLEARGLPPGEE